MGEMLKEIKKNPGTRPSKEDGGTMQVPPFIPTLREIGLTKRDSSQAQKIALAIEIEPHFAEEAKKRQIRKPIISVVENVPQQKSRDQAGRQNWWKMSHRLNPATRQRGGQGDGKMSHDPIVARDQAAKSVCMTEVEIVPPPSCSHARGGGDENRY